MSFHLAAWAQSTNPTALTAISALVDQAIRTSGNDVTVPDGVDLLIATYALGSILTRAQLQSPSLRRLLNLEIRPIDQSAVSVTAQPLPWMPRFFDPIQLRHDENLDAFIVTTGGAAAINYVAAWLATSPIRPINGDVRTTRLTGTTTLAANAWTQVPLTLTDTLPAGRWQVVGARFESATAILGRLIFKGNTGQEGGLSLRPGAVATQSAIRVLPEEGRAGNLGAWGEFDHNVLPDAEFLANAADTSETVFLDLIKLA